jgi:hypothetical protein
MRRTLLLLVLAGTACWAQSPSALESDSKGWTDIQPNAAFKGWTRLPFMVTTPMAAESQWKVDGKTLICEGDKGHEWLRFDKEVANFIFHAEYRFTKVEGKKGYNSGIMARNSADGSIYFQAQAGEEGTGWLFGAWPIEGKSTRFNLRNEMKENRVKPAGEWNVYEVRAEGPKMSVWVNGGETTAKADIPILKGFVGLEAEGYRIEFRNLKLKELK